MPTVLVIDDDRTIHVLVERALGGVADVVSATSADEGLKKVDELRPDVVLLDIQLPDTNGLAVFCQIHELDRRLPVIFITVEAGSQTAIEAMQLGAYDYVAKPLDVSKLRMLVERAIETRQMVSTPVAIAADEELAQDGELFIGRSPAMLEVFKAIGRVARQNVTVLIRGESGTGKELVARALVQHGDRSEAPFLAVNCAALPENLLESELFGHEKGAFTGADNRRIGKFEQANGGTLFLDEIGDMTPGVQAKVLRVLQEQSFERVGGTRQLRTDVRVIAATNRDLEAMVEEGEYREDLLYRLNGVTIQLPGLRDRTEDIPLLLQYFLNRAKRDLDKPDLEGISPEATEVLCQYGWPGNVRQLQAVVRRMVLDCVTPVITPDSLPQAVRDSAKKVGVAHGNGQGEPVPVPSPSGVDLAGFVEQLLAEESTDIYSETLEYMERYVLSRVLRATGGNQSQAAEMLGITRGKIRDRVATYNLSLRSSEEVRTPNGV